ncbi:MFS transporter [Ensifer sp. NM-2]|uniref:MFS transporter n=1 Tax=Ensifer sp. NM-2 TaxID=2109730 RepID=UPI000D12FCF2|nr:MFS transporter [Ensifer sp. NM-2]PSS64505.1 MFS transporter [Ensifer sp. NM-2]
MRAEDKDSPIRIWLAVIMLGIASFIMVTTEFAPIGLLSQIALDLGKDQAAVGLTMTLYAWIGAASGLLSAVLLQKFPRKPLLIVLMLVLSATNLAAMISHSFDGLLLARTVGAIVHGFFWAMAAAVASQIAPSHRMGVATAIVFGGISMATVVGVPLANLVGQASGWRTAFGSIGAVGLLTSVLMGVVLPKMQPGSPAGWRELGSVFRRPDLLGIYAVTAFMAAANFAAYTFIEPFLREVPNLPHVMIGALLFGFGGAGFLGNILTGLLIDRFMKSIITAGLVALCLALVGLGWFGPQLGTGRVLVLLVIWGAAIAALFAGLQTWILRAAGATVMSAAAIHSAVINSAIGFGAIFGARILTVSSVSGVMLAAGMVVIVPLLLILLQAAPRAAPKERGTF